MTDPSSSWPIRMMKDYRQHLPMNCGSVAAVFALFGLDNVVPEELVKVLSEEKLTPTRITEIINANPPATIKAAWQRRQIKIPNSAGVPGSVEQRPLAFLQNLSPAVVTIGIQDVLAANDLRCAIISGFDGKSYHWQTFYVPTGGKEVLTYNARPKWHPMIVSAHGGVPTGLVFVTGPPLKR